MTEQVAIDLIADILSKLDPDEIGWVIEAVGDKLKLCSTCWDSSEDGHTCYID